MRSSFLCSYLVSCRTQRRTSFKQEVIEVTEKLFGDQRFPGGGESLPLCCLPFLLFKTSVFVPFVIFCEILFPLQLLSFLQNRFATEMDLVHQPVVAIL